MNLPLNGTWKTGEPMPTSRSSFAYANIGKKIYCAGGLITTTNSNATNVLEIYDTENKYWMTGKPMPESLYMMGSVAVGNEFYCLGGADATSISNRIYIYDTTTNIWRVSPYTLPTARGALRCCYVDGKIFCVGGIIDRTAQSWVFTDKVEILDLASGTWSTGCPLPVKLGFGCLHHNNGLLYWLSGGHTSGTINSKKSYIYDIVNDHWTEGTDLPSNQIHYASDVCDEKIYIIGGTNYDTMQHQNTFLSYDINNDTYIALPSMPTIRTACGGVIVGNKIYVIGGTNEKLSNTVEIYPAEEPSSVDNKCCCCGSIKLEINIPVNNNLEMLDKLKEIVSAAKGCDNSDCCK
ncbi:hypothetical protein K413DRAFT_3054 [Clostridium sp. ASBs410]|nr:hypothetical protein K413DRAFT_3054 [Clostridium sp. ASBs410]